MAYRTTQQIAELLRTQRSDRGWSLAEASERYEIPAERLASCEAGEVLLTATESSRVAVALGITASEIWEDRPKLAGARFRKTNGPEDAAVAEIERRLRDFRRVAALSGK